MSDSMMKKNLTRIAGFTLVELSIALVVISFIASAMITIAGRRTESDRREITLERIQRIEAALGAYILDLKRLPCPARGELELDDNASGVADTLDTTNNPPTHCANTQVAGEAIRLGTIPVVTLGLSDEFMVDGWNRRFTYVVHEDFVVAEDFTDPSTPPDPTSRFGFLREKPDPYSDLWPNPAEAYLDTATPDPMVGTMLIFNEQDGAYVSGLSTATEQELNIRSNTALYVIVSHGPNGHGAWARNGGTRIDRSATMTISTAEQENSPYPNADDAEFTQDRNRASFDDIIVYREYDQIIELAGGFTDEVLCKSAHYTLYPYDAALPVTAGPVGCLNIEVAAGTYTDGADWILEGNCAYRQQLFATAINDLCFVEEPE